MKTIKVLAAVALIALATSALAQSASFKALRENFADDQDVHSLKVSGFMCRALL